MDLYKAHARRAISFLIALVIAATVLFCIFTAPAATYQRQVVGTCNYTYSQTILTYLNQLRKSRKVTTVALDRELTDAAMQRAAEIAVMFSHTRPDGSSWYTVNSRVRAENIASGYLTPKDAYLGWYGSSGHYANMVRNGYKAVGIGCFYDGSTWYWVQLFGDQLKNKDSRRASSVSEFTVNVKGSDPGKTSYAPPKLSKLKASASNEMKISWTPVQGITKYQIGCMMPGASDWVAIDLNGIGSGRALDTVLMGLVYKGKYSIRIRGVYDLNGSTKYTKWSTTKSVKIK